MVSVHGTVTSVCLFNKQNHNPLKSINSFSIRISVRKLKEGKVTTELFGFLTCPPNAEMRVVHPKAMPEILTKPQDWWHWLTAPAEEALKLQRPLPDRMLGIVAEGVRENAA